MPGRPVFRIQLPDPPLPLLRPASSMTPLLVAHATTPSPRFQVSASGLPEPHHTTPQTQYSSACSGHPPFWTSVPNPPADTPPRSRSPILGVDGNWIRSFLDMTPRLASSTFRHPAAPDPAVPFAVTSPLGTPHPRTQARPTSRYPPNTHGAPACPRLVGALAFLPGLLGTFCHLAPLPRLTHPVHQPPIPSCPLSRPTSQLRGCWSGSQLVSALQHFTSD